MIYFIEKMDKLTLINKIFKNVRIENERISVPVLENKSTSICYKKLLKYLIQNRIKEVILSKEFKDEKNLKTILKSNNIRINDGRWLFKYIVYEMVVYIIKLKKIKKQETEVAILTNETVDTSVENIKLFAKEFKRVNVVTNHIEKFKKIEEELYNKYGIAITVTNNKKKSLSKSKIILNMDFPNELINKFQVMEDAIIINPEGDIKIQNKRFSGININNYIIDITKIEEIDCWKVKKYELSQILETNIYKKDNFFNIRKNIKKYGFKITDLIGNNGILSI